MVLTLLTINGLRGFASPQTLRFASPNTQLGSGLTILVGANNVGKSTAIEAIRALAQRNQNPSFTQGRRNQKAGDAVKLSLTSHDGLHVELRSVKPGSSETERESQPSEFDLSNVLVLPSRRTFSPYFNRSEMGRVDYMNNMGFPAIRSSTVDQFTYRLFTANKNQDSFNQVLKKVLDPVPDWTIDQLDTGQHFLKIKTGDAAHSSEGLGEGLVSLFYIIDALYDSNPGDIIAIDEPELSLHPSLQRKLAILFTEYAKDRQIIIATHSPYFVNLEALQNGATVARVYLKDGESQISQLSESSAKGISGLLRNYNNPHIFGLNAQEAFFLEDQIILTEGQEDVIFYRTVQDKLGFNLKGTFFGWGIGGADNMDKIARVLKDLGFVRVVGILDGNRKESIEKLSSDFSDFHFFAIPADDVRTKEERHHEKVIGLLDETKQIRSEHFDETKNLFEKANNYLCALPPT